MVELAGPGSQGWWGRGDRTLGLSRAPGLRLRLDCSLLPGLLLAPRVSFPLGLCIKEGVYSPWSVWPTASLADGQSPELTGKEHKQGPWWAAVTQNLLAEKQ